MSEKASTRPSRIALFGRATVAILVLIAMPVPADTPYEFRQLALSDGKRLDYALVLPVGFEPSKSYPGVLALPPGGQSRDMVLAVIGSWASEARKRGWIVVSPVAPGLFFHQGSERYIPELLAHLRKELRFEHDGLHVLGASNGGLSAFRVATLHPENYLSVTVAPGYPTRGDRERLEGIVGMPVTLLVGEEDRGWLERSRDTKKILESLGGTVELEILPGQGHFILRDLASTRLFKIFEKARKAP